MSALPVSRESGLRMPLGVVALKVTRGFFKNYCYLGVDRVARASFLVDPAWEQATIESALERSGATCEAVLLTHAHPDHVDLADTMAARLGVPVYLSRAEIEQSGFRCRNLCALEDGQRIRVGSHELTALLTPGHTGGSMCFLGDGNLFSGDTLFAEGCGMCVGPGADPVAMFRGLRRLKETVPGDTRVFSGHSYGQPPGRTMSWLLDHNLYLQFERESDFVRYRMRSGQAGWADFK